MPSDTAQRGRPIAMILTAVLLLGLSAAVPAAAAPADPPTHCTTAPTVPADPNAHCPTTTPSCVTPSPGATGPTTAAASKPPGNKTSSTSACPGTPPPGRQHSNWPLIGSITAILLALLALLAVAVRRSGTGRHSAHAPATHHDAGPVAAPRSPTAPSPVPSVRRVPRPANLLPATVGTDLHPQGYVDIDDCLYRAVWSEPAEPPPGPGEPVDVARPDPHDETHDPHVLLAFPADSPRRHHAR